MTDCQPLHQARLLLLAALAVVLLLTACAGSTPEPLNAVVSVPAPEPRVVASASILGTTFFDAVVGDDVVVLLGQPSGDNQRLVRHALDRSTGDTLWRTESDGTIGNLTFQHAVVEGVYLEGFNDEFRAYDAATGELRWELEPAWDFRVRGPFVLRKGDVDSEREVVEAATGSPFIDGDLRFFTNDTGYVRTPERTTIGIDLATGEEIWRFDGDLSPFALPRDTIHRDVTAMIRQDVGDLVVGVEIATGAIVWDRAVSPSRVDRSADGRWAVVHEGTDLEVIDVLTGELVWSTKLDHEKTQIHVTAGAVIEGVGEYVDFTVQGDDVGGAYMVNEVRAFAIDTGRELWSASGLKNTTLHMSTTPTAQTQTNPAAVILAKREGDPREFFGSVRLFDPLTGEAITPDIALAHGQPTLDRSGVFIVGRTGAVMADGELQSFDGTTLAPFSGSAQRVVVGDDVLIALGDPISIIEWH